ncbi:hypothetical protein [Hyphomonas sp.]|uniref:hypothetical protein n=1 Tax=Hyphomonas sp. TaxID=87 RepID=UPI0025C66C74|nr:hypothetical protein [Hyphomonas sp.]MBI1399225.1 hypothetical protein [Hyphomonas sp.]
MSFGGGPTGFDAIQALVAARDSLPAVADKDWAAASGLIVKKLLNAAGQTAEGLMALRTAVGEEIFEAQLKSLSHHQAKLLAKRLDKSVPDLDVSTARAAVAHIRTLLTVPAAVQSGGSADPATEETVDAASTPESETMNEPLGDDTPPSPPASPNPYFGRKSFRTG